MHWITEEIVKRIADEKVMGFDNGPRQAALKSLLDWIEEKEGEALDAMHAEDPLVCDTCGASLATFYPPEPDGMNHAICECGEFEIRYSDGMTLREAAAQAKGGEA